MDSQKITKNSTLIKSKTRVKDFGEVFTPDFIVKEMCDLIPSEIWEDIDKTFLEPACGNGNFLVEILERKLKHCKTDNDVIRAYESIQGIDIQEDNVQQAKARMFEMLPRYVKISTADIVFDILNRNIICGDSLRIMEEWIKESEV